MRLDRVLAAFVLLAVAAAVAPAVAHADGAANLSWNACTGPVNVSAAGGSSLDAYVSVLGQSLTAQAYECVTIGRAGLGGPMRDAWRFDPTGCEGSSRFDLNTFLPIESKCANFQDDLQSLQIKDFSFDPTTGKVRITLANAYPNADPVTGAARGNPLATNPAQRYFLANYHFDLTQASAGATPPDLSTCGGVEVPVCFELTAASWLDLNGNEIAWQFANQFLTVNDPHDSENCPSITPAIPRTWGAVKSQYRE